MIQLASLWSEKLENCLIVPMEQYKLSAFCNSPQNNTSSWRIDLHYSTYARNSIHSLRVKSVPSS